MPSTDAIKTHAGIEVTINRVASISLVGVWSLAHCPCGSLWCTRWVVLSGGSGRPGMKTGGTSLNVRMQV